MKNLTVGILAHVDTGKTTLSEAFLYKSGEIRRLGRVDRRDSFLDTNEIERQRGITIFSKQASFNYGNMEITLLDTPGHTDFSAETERTLSVLDYAILAVSGSEGVQSHTEALFKLLKHYNIPVFIFVNKTDSPLFDKAEITEGLKSYFGDTCIDFSEESFLLEAENLALCDDALYEEYLSGASFSDTAIAEAIRKRKVFPCFFGSALKLFGIDYFLSSFEKYTLPTEYPSVFGARVYKVSEDERGQRLAHLKITGGSIRVKDIVSFADSSGVAINEKINEIRVYSGKKYKNIQEATGGMICTLTGLSNIYPGQGLGFEKHTEQGIFQPVISYAVRLDGQTDLNTAYSAFKRLEAEDPKLNMVWNPQLKEIQLQLMGEVQAEVLKQTLWDRFKISAELEEGGVVYKETILNSVEGAGHYEPLRHYAEVHLMLEPLERGSGIVIDTSCSEDILDKSWQRLILTHLSEKTHIGVLTGSPVTDIKITLLAGKAHQKHTEGGDFRQAAYRAVRQGLRLAESILLEPWYSFLITLPTENIGRAMNDIQNMGGSFSPPKPSGDMSILSGYAPVAGLRSYASELISYTHGAGKISLDFSGYEKCLNQDEVIKKIAYNCDADTENTADSVFCSHGAGYLVRWNEADALMHIEKQKEKKETTAPKNKEYKRSDASDAELLEIFERTYGKIQRKNFNESKPKKLSSASAVKYKPIQKRSTSRGEYLLVDGYNILFAWYDLKNASADDMELARNILVSRLSNYRTMQNAEIILVFDAYKVKGNIGSIEKIGGISVVYTREAEIADSYIEKTSKQLMKDYSVRVATSDRLEQIIIFGGGAVRISAEEFLKELEAAEEKIQEIISEEKQKGAKLLAPEHKIKYETEK